MGTSEQHYSLRWNDYTVKIVTAFQSLRDEEDFVDVTVACDGHHYSAHKIVLSACSPYFRSLLRANPCQHPIVILKDVGHLEMERLLEFMYNGEVNIAQDHLAAFLKTAETLKIRGLAGSSEEMDQIHRDNSLHGFPGCYSGGTSTSGRNSPTSCFPSMQEKDDDITETSFTSQTNSPPCKRRKGSSGTATSTHPENSTSHTSDSIPSESLLEGAAERTGSASGNGGLDLDDSRDERRELKSEPMDHIGSNPLPDGLGSHHTGAAPGGAVCKPLNLSLRPTPAIQQVNGSSNSFPPSLSIRHQQGIQQQQSNFTHQQFSVTSPSSTVTLIPYPQVKVEAEDFKIDSLAVPLELAGPATAELQGYPEIAMDLVCPPDSLSATHGDNNHAPSTAGSSGPINETTLMNSSSSEYKCKIYPCPDCHKVFRHPMSLHHHRHVHKGTYTCQSCGKVFSRRWDLHRHIHRSKMGCRRPNHAAPMGAQGIISAPHLDHPYDLNNPPSN